MNDLQKTYIRNQILTMPMKVTQEITHKNKKFNKRSDYDNIINYIDNFIVGENLNRFLVLPGLRDVGKTTILYQHFQFFLAGHMKNTKYSEGLYFFQSEDIHIPDIIWLFFQHHVILVKQKI